MLDAGEKLGLGKCAALGISDVLAPPSNKLALILDLGVDCCFKRRPILHALRIIDNGVKKDFVILRGCNDKTLWGKFDSI